MIYRGLVAEGNTPVVLTGRSRRKIERFEALHEGVSLHVDIEECVCVRRCLLVRDYIFIVVCVEC